MLKNLTSNRRVLLLPARLTLILVAAALFSSSWFGFPPISAQASGPAISQVTTNLGQYARGQIPAYLRLEITFQVETRAENLQLPFDPVPPPGVMPGTGISVDALFTRDGWKTTYRQPAFYYQDFEHQVKSGREWMYPTGEFSWKVRFAPPRPGDWQFKLVAQDASGRTETAAQSFRVVPSSIPGFVRVSERDARYFEFENGAYFPSLGYNMNYDHLSWTNPVLDNEQNLRRMGENGVQLVRLWLSQWGIYGSAWNPWNSIDPKKHGSYVPDVGLTFEQAAPGSDVSLLLTPENNPCMVLGFMKLSPAVKRNTTYRVQVRYLTEGVRGPRAADEPYGLVVKTGDWLSGGESHCALPGAGSAVTPRVSDDSSGWQTLEGTLEIGDRDFLPNFYLVLENASTGRAYVDSVEIREVLPYGEFGPNILPKPWMAHHLYMEQRSSFAFDKVVELAEIHGVYLRPVVLEKLDWIFSRIDFDGAPILDVPACKDNTPRNDPSQCPGDKWFYGSGREVTKVRWLQQAWWRYLQARWGYSTSIHSWELLNEGDPANGQHFAMADEFGKYMRQFAPNHHLVSTSFWHSFPSRAFWGNPGYAYVDFADVHQYADPNKPGFTDTAAWTYDASMQYGAYRPGGAQKPVIRGETGFASLRGSATERFKEDTGGIWLHNLVWGGINPGGLIESYWYENAHIYWKNADGSLVDLRPVFRTYYNFIHTVPLNNGRYVDAAASTSTSQLRAWGQRDQLTTCAHLWIHNKDHTWQNALKDSVSPATGVVTLPGLLPGRTYQVEWWDTYQPDPARQVVQLERIRALGDGTLNLEISNLKSDLAVKLFVVQENGFASCPTGGRAPASPLQPRLWGAPAFLPGLSFP